MRLSFNEVRSRDTHTMSNGWAEGWTSQQRRRWEKIAIKRIEWSRVTAACFLCVFRGRRSRRIFPAKSEKWFIPALARAQEMHVNETERKEMRKWGERERGMRYPIQTHMRTYILLTTWVEPWLLVVCYTDALLSSPSRLLKKSINQRRRRNSSVKSL